MFKVSPQDLSGIHQHFSEANKIFLLGPLYARVVGAPTVVSLKICDVAFNALKGLLEITGKLTVGTFTVLPNLMCLIAGYEQIHNPFSLKNGLKAFKLSILSLVTIPKIFCIYLIDPTLATFSQVRLERDRLQKNFDQLTSENNHLQQDFDQLNLERDHLQQAFEQSNSERDHLQQDFDQLNLERDHLQQDFDQLTLEKNASFPTSTEKKSIKEKVEKSDSSSSCPTVTELTKEEVEMLQTLHSDFGLDTSHLSKKTDIIQFLLSHLTEANQAASKSNQQIEELKKENAQLKNMPSIPPPPLSPPPPPPAPVKEKIVAPLKRSRPSKRPSPQPALDPDLVKHMRGRREVFGSEDVGEIFARNIDEKEEQGLLPKKEKIDFKKALHELKDILSFLEEDDNLVEQIEAGLKQIGVEKDSEIGKKLQPLIDRVREDDFDLEILQETIEEEIQKL